MRLTKVFFWGLLISFLGSLPLGTLNVIAMQIGVQESIKNAIYFSLGSLTVEMIYVRISLVGINWVTKQKKLFKWMEWITVAIIIALAIGSFIGAMQPNQAKNAALDNDMPRYLLGMMLSAINPVQIPFWFGWSAVLFAKKILIPQNSYYNVYIVGIGLGTLLANGIFIFGGKYLVEKLNASGSLLNWIIGGIFTVTAIILIIKILLHKGGASKLAKAEAGTQP
jgi:threonine/homoserine/homoserine lactone efflux protein